MDIVMPEKQYLLFLDDVRLPANALIGDHSAALLQLFAGLNPERVMASAMAVGSARYALAKAIGYAKERTVWSVPIGAHQGLAHPLAQVKIELELARLMMQKAATLYDEGDDMGAGESANMAKYAAAEASTRAVDQAIQTLGGSSMTAEFGLGAMRAGPAGVTALPSLAVPLPKPAVGSIDGHAGAGGLGVVGACAIVRAGPASTFAFSEVLLGLAPAMISLTTLPRLVPRAASR